MSCHGCTKKYSLFNKENGCPNCGYSYCSNCIKFKAIIPKLGRTTHSVCRSCHLALSDVLAKNEQPEHPAASLQRLKSLDNPAKPPITFYQRDQKMEQLKSGLAQSETELADRLEKLREGRRKERLPSEDEIAQRLALLKGEDPSRATSASSNVVLTPDLRTEQQQADDLINQYREEQELGLMHPSPVDDIANRLAQLRGQDPQNVPGSSKAKPVAELFVPSAEDNFGELPVSDAKALLSQLTNPDMAGLESAAQKCIKDSRSQLVSQNLDGKEANSQASLEVELGSDEEQIIKRVLAEAALEEKLAIAELSDEPNSESEELPWCVICNEDAKKRCEGCDGDLYCEACFKQGHADEDMRTHKSIVYKKTKNTK